MYMGRASRTTTIDSTVRCTVGCVVGGVLGGIVGGWGVTEGVRWRGVQLS
jgi:Na+/glutamate symporter